MNKSKTKEKIRPLYVFALGLILICIVVAVWVYYNHTQRKTPAIQGVKNNIPLAKDIAKAFEKGESNDIKPYKKSFGENGANTTQSKYFFCLPNTVAIERTTTIKGKVSKDYLAVVPLYKEHAEELYQLVRKSGKDHFGKEETYEEYGRSVIKTEKRIMDNTSMKGVFHGAKKEGPFKLIGIIGLSKLKYKDEEGVLNGFYAFGAPEITGVKGAAATAMWGYISHYFSCDVSKVRAKKIILSMLKDNLRSEKVAKDLLFEKKGKKYNIVDYGKDHKRKDMIPYELTLEQWKKKYLK